jgi:hypothetical protein
MIDLNEKEKELVMLIKSVPSFVGSRRTVEIYV